MIPDVFWVEAPFPGRIGIVPRPRGGDWLQDEVKGLKLAGIQMVVSLLTSMERAELELQDEEQICRDEGLRYRSLPIQDRGLPDRHEDMKALTKEILESLEAGEDTVVHCRQGIGRSALTVAAVLVVSGHAPDAALELIAAARERDVPDTEEQMAWVHQFASRFGGTKPRKDTGSRAAEKKTRYPSSD